VYLNPYVETCDKWASFPILIDFYVRLIHLVTVQTVLSCRNPKLLHRLYCTVNGGVHRRAYRF
ncbi:MAG: hypothetical protein WAL66_09190, partial [Nitrososphaeraceae archaeon]